MVEKLEAKESVKWQVLAEDIEDRSCMRPTNFAKHKLKHSGLILLVSMTLSLLSYSMEEATPNKVLILVSHLP